MAEEQKPVEVPTENPAAEVKVEETPAATTEAAAAEVAAPAAEPTEVEEAPAAATEEPAKKAEEVAPVDAGSLEHKGSNFPK
jgi:hypothetical protein